jgi:hypothetical protein
VTQGPLPWTKLLGGIGIIFLVGFVGKKAAVKLGLTEKSRLDMLQPHVRSRVEELIRRMAEKGIKLYVGSTKRTREKQAKIVSAGRSAAPVSWHLLGRAVDIYPVDPVTGKPDTSGKNINLFKTMMKEAEALGFRQLAFKPDGSKLYIMGAKGEFWDAGHIEYRDGMTIAQAAQREKHLMV